MLKICCHDVLQSSHFSSSQLKAFEIKSPFEWFKEATEKWQDYPLVLAVVVEGVNQYPEWIKYIGDHPKWTVQSHGLHHWNYKHLTYNMAVDELTLSKKLLEKTFGQKVTEFYPPRLAYNDFTQQAAKEAGMVEVRENFRPNHWLNDRSIPSIYFHYWSGGNLKLMEKVCQLLQEN